LKPHLDKKRFNYEWYIIPSSALHLKFDEISNDGQLKERWIIIPSTFDNTIYVRGPNMDMINYDLDLSFLVLKDSPRRQGPCRRPDLIEECERIIEQHMSNFKIMHEQEKRRG
jgi:hypothetical protein